MKLSHSIGRGVAVGFLATVLGAVFSVVPAALFFLTGPQAVFEPARTFLNVFGIIALTLIYFLLHLIPVVLSGVLVSYLWNAFTTLPSPLKTLIAFLAVLAASICTAWMYTIVSSVGFSEYTSIEYLLVFGTEFCYIASFMLLVKKVLLPSNRNDQEVVA